MQKDKDRNKLKTSKIDFLVRMMFEQKKILLYP